MIDKHGSVTQRQRRNKETHSREGGWTGIKAKNKRGEREETMRDGSNTLEKRVKE